MRRAVNGMSGVFLLLVGSVQLKAPSHEWMEASSDTNKRAEGDEDSGRNDDSCDGVGVDADFATEFEANRRTLEDAGVGVPLSKSKLRASTEGDVGVGGSKRGGGEVDTVAEGEDIRGEVDD